MKLLIAFITIYFLAATVPVAARTCTYEQRKSIEPLLSDAKYKIKTLSIPDEYISVALPREQWLRIFKAFECKGFFHK